jgi:hypothetical protein
MASYFKKGLEVIGKHGWLAMSRLVLSQCFLASYWSTGFERFRLPLALASNWLEDKQIIRQLQGQMTNSTTPSIKGNQQQANQVSLLVKKIHL